MKQQKSKLKITVLKRFKPEEVFKDPPIKTKYDGPCSLYEDGQVFYLEDCSMPEGFCSYAWDAVYPFVLTLRFHGNFLA